MENQIKGLKIRKWIEYFEETLENETGIKFDELHKFDKRYILSWNFRDGYQTD